jgi:hypothetical protein
MRHRARPKAREGPFRKYLVLWYVQTRLRLCSDMVFRYKVGTTLDSGRNESRCRCPSSHIYEAALETSDYFAAVSMPGPAAGHQYQK